MSELTSQITVLKADLTNLDHQRDIIVMTNAYACDPMGGGEPLPAEVLDRLIEGLQNHPTTLVFLAYIDGNAVGIASCFLGFSTFAAKPLINIHDLSVVPEYRGRGISRALLDAVADYGKNTGCVKLTLEVLEVNARARSVYEAAGFGGWTHGDAGGGTLFYSRTL